MNFSDFPGGASRASAPRRRRPSDHRQPLAAPSHPPSPHARWSGPLISIGVLLSILFATFLDSARGDLPPPAYVGTQSSWPVYEMETFTYKNITWKVPKQGTHAAWFDWTKVDGCMDSSYIYSCPNERQLLLTFDDGPCSYTDWLLNELRDANAKGTFCLIGRQFAGYEDVVRRIAYEGHDLCVHTWSHPHMTELNTTAMIDEVLNTVKVFNDTLGVIPKYFRPPFGEIDLRLKAIVETLGMSVLRWNFDSYDYLRDPVQLLERYKTYIQKDGPSTSWLTLQHDLHNTTVSTQKGIIKWARESNYNVSTPSACRKESRWANGGQLPVRATSFWATATASNGVSRTALPNLPNNGLGGGIASFYNDGARPSTATIGGGFVSATATATATGSAAAPTTAQPTSKNTERATGTLVVATPAATSAAATAQPPATTQAAVLPATTVRPSAASLASTPLQAIWILAIFFAVLLL